MRRWTHGFLLLILGLLPAMIVLAQAPTPTPPGPGDLPPPFEVTPGSPAPTSGPPIGPGPGGDPAPTTTGPSDPVGPPIGATEAPLATDAPTATPEPTQVPTAEGIDILLPARIDLELLATSQLGDQRPAGWSGSTDSTDQQFALLVRLDLEILAGALLGVDVRPDAWIGLIPSTGTAIARDIRHDLELLVDTAGIQRPAGWTGGDPLQRCNRSTQALVAFLEQGGVFTLQADRTADDFCHQAMIEASTFVEINFLSNPGSAGIAAAQVTDGEPAIASEDAVGFLDLAATIRGGVIPVGERIEPVARSGEGLMLVRGIGFELFVDYRFTNVTEAAFNSLPTAGAVRVAPRCDTDWCD
jgi:hypothetical protein